VDELLPGAHPGLDIVCNGILHGSDFIYPSELYSLPSDADSPPDKAALAKESFRIAGKLAKIGEVSRLRDYFRSTLTQFSVFIDQPWALSSISAMLLTLALASDKPISTAQEFKRETSLLLQDCSPRSRVLVRRALGNAVHNVAITLWKQRSYNHALKALMQAVLWDPTLIPKALPRHFLSIALPGFRRI
jgi:hypothetical protein